MWGLGPRIDVPVSVGRYFAIEPSAGALFPIVRDRFYYVDEAQQPQVVHQPARAILWLELGLVLKIP
jgi:hypothetical protein